MVTGISAQCGAGMAPIIASLRASAPEAETQIVAVEQAAIGAAISAFMPHVQTTIDTAKFIAPDLVLDQPGMPPVTP